MSLNSVAIELLEQLEGVLSKMGKEEFAAPVSVLNDASIGQHVRHTLEFFICLMDCEAQDVLNYDNRKHDKYIQEDKHLAITVIHSLIDFLRQNSERNFNITLEVCYGENEEASIRANTNFQRELVYNIEHAIHHMALMKIGLTSICPEIKLDKSFGVASSTLRYAEHHQPKSK